MLVPAILAAAAVTALYLAPFGPTMLDLGVYRAGARALIDGADVYKVVGPGGLPFTYPVFAAVVFVPFAVVPPVVAKLAITLLSLCALFVLCYLTLREVLPRAERVVLLRWSLPAALVASVAYPVLGTLLYGQVNLVLAGMVLIDVLVVRGRARGVLVGLATGIKLTPGLFVVYYLATGQWRAARNAALTAGATLAVGLLVAPGPTWAFLTGYMLDPGRTGDVAFNGNQSILAMTARLLGDTHPPKALTWLVAAVVVLAAMVAARRLHARGQELAAVCAVAAAALLASPVSWTHHWVWCVPATGVLAAWAYRGGPWRVTPWRWCVIGAAALVLWIGPMQFTPADGLPAVMADAYGLLALVFLGWAALQARRAPDVTGR
ncbi:glycosyltransferase 87 family protein [Dactylosporangium sp. CA-139066]|uniref:glycosyltransferase 87 family protein n=1 Tax=Dactylosporangium sp. CA-139066 TaxID=3239930 RepID=UPI003D909289